MDNQTDSPQAPPVELSPENQPITSDNIVELPQPLLETIKETPPQALSPELSTEQPQPIVEQITPTLQGEIVEQKEKLVNQESQQVSNKTFNPTGRGGFGDNPSHINKKGRPPKDWTWKMLLEEVAEEFPKAKDGTSSRWQFKQLVAKRLFTLAIGGNVQAIKELMDRTDGRATQSLTFEGLQLPKPILDGLTKHVSTDDSDH